MGYLIRHFQSEERAAKTPARKLRTRNDVAYRDSNTRLTYSAYEMITARETIIGERELK